MSDRKAYRILRGTYSRRDGEMQIVKDNQGNVIKKARAHVVYQSKTDANPHARDEIMMTDVEAFRFGLQRLQPLGRRDVKTLDVQNAPAQVEIAEDDDSGRDDTIRALIEEGNAVTGKKNIEKWRKTVIHSELLEDVPNTKSDILAALEGLLEAGSEE